MTNGSARFPRPSVMASATMAADALGPAEARGAAIATGASTSADRAEAVAGGPARRRALAAAGAGALGLLLGGCGFQLRQPVALGIQRLALSGFVPRSAMAAALRRALPSSVSEVASPAAAEVVVQALDDRFERTVAASTAAGQVREFRLRVSLRFRLTRADGSELLGDTLLEQQRDMSYTETAALAKEGEQALLVNDMRDDIARQLLRMLAAAGSSAR